MMEKGQKASRPYFDEIFTHVFTLSDREMVIVSMAYIEGALQRLLEKRLIPFGDTHGNKWVSYPLTKKADLAYHTGVMPISYTKTIKILSSIRNSFAHDPSVTTIIDKKNENHLNSFFERIENGMSKAKDHVAHEVESEGISREVVERFFSERNSIVFILCTIYEKICENIDKIEQITSYE